MSVLLQDEDKTNPKRIILEERRALAISSNSHHYEKQLINRRIKPSQALGSYTESTGNNPVKNIGQKP